MTFYFVDKIDELSYPNIAGRKHFSEKTPWRHELSNGTAVIVPGVIAEAVGQLVSWLSIYQSNFTTRPVFLFARNIQMKEVVPVGSELELEAQILRMEEQAFTFSGKAFYRGKEVIAIDQSGGYFWPLSNLEDPKLASDRFQVLTNKGLRADDPWDSGFNFAKFGGKLIEATEGMRRYLCQFPASCEFFGDHFPRFPVTPIVMINEMICQRTASLFAEEGKTARLRTIQNLKIKSFIKPNTDVMVQVWKAKVEGNLATTHVEIFLEGKKILQGQYLFELEGDKGHGLIQ